MGYYQTPEDAAMGDIPPRYARVLASEIRSNTAVVIVESNEPPLRHYSIDVVYKYDEGWSVFSESGSIGDEGDWEVWVAHPETEAAETDRGVGIFVGQMPEGVSSVRIRWGDHESDASTFGSHYLAIDWDCACDSGSRPEVIHAE